MSDFTTILGGAGGAIEKAYDEAIARAIEVADLKADISFVSIFANLIRKMDESSQTVV